MGEYVVELKNVTKRFPGVVALHNMQLAVKPGEIHGLIGENGAGKSTLIKVLTGVHMADEGEIYVHGEKKVFRNPNESAAAGIACVYQELNIEKLLSVTDNIFINKWTRKGFLLDYESMHRKAAEVMQSLGQDIDPRKPAGTFGMGVQQMIEIAKAVLIDAKMIIMDEPTSSLGEKEVKQLMATCRELKARGVGILFVSHKLEELFELCDRVTVMRDGQTVGTKVVKETNKDDLIAMMVGRELTNYYTRDYLEPGEVVLKCDHISDGKMAKDASFELRKGEIIGFAGLVGAGRSETMKAVFGLAPHMTGDVYVEGQKVQIKSPVDALKYGIALVPESRKEEGLYKVQSVRFNSTIEVLSQFIKNLRVNLKKEEEITQKYIDMMATKTPSQDQVIGNLSGGNQQKVMIGRWLATDPKILILDEPTRGVDVGAKAEIYTIMNELVKRGMSIIMISSELPEIINMSDRVYVMNDGRVTGCLDHDSVTQEGIMQLAAK